MFLNFKQEAEKVYITLEDLLNDNFQPIKN